MYYALDEICESQTAVLYLPSTIRSAMRCAHWTADTLGQLIFISAHSHMSQLISVWLLSSILLTQTIFERKGQGGILFICSRRLEKCCDLFFRVHSMQTLVIASDHGRKWLSGASLEHTTCGAFLVKVYVRFSLRKSSNKIFAFARLTQLWTFTVANPCLELRHYPEDNEYYRYRVHRVILLR